VVAAAIVFLGSTAVAQEYTSICNDPGDRALFSCFHEIAAYTNWMVVRNNAAVEGKLQQAVNTLYKGVQEQWTGPLRKRTYMRLLYVLAPTLILIYFLLVLYIQRAYPPRVPPGGRAQWGAEKLAIVGLPIVLLGALIGERVFTYYNMEKDYALLPKTIGAFVHVRTPGEVVNYTEKPCDLVYQENDILLARCMQDWADQSAREKQRFVLTSGFTDPELLRSLIRVGEACQEAERLPYWFNNKSGTFEVKMDCPVFADNEAGVTLGHFRGLFDELQSWLSGSGTLTLENAFGVRSTTGDLVYRDKVQSLIGTDKDRTHREQFARESAVWIGICFLLFVTAAGSIYVCRREQLEGGSAGHGRGVKAVLQSGAGLAAALLLLIVYLVMVS
jgi:hypothetical protein